MAYPKSDPKYGECIDEHFIETESGTKRVAILKKNGKTFLCTQTLYEDRKTHEMKFGKAIWFRIEDGTAEDMLSVAAAMLAKHLKREPDV